MSLNSHSYFEPLILALPLLYFLAALPSLMNRPARKTWRLTEAAGALAVVLVVLSLCNGLLRLPLSQLDLLGHTMALLVTALGLVVIRYSRRYLDGESGQERYQASLLITLASASALTLSQHLGLMVLCWFGVSIGLHQLLTFYHERRPALIAAHKKFILSRAADLLLLIFLLVVYAEVGSLQLSAVEQKIQAGITFGLHFSAVLLAVAVLLRTAQIPVHGWLMQVMEAPTPVSALLHAGVINLGGFVLLRSHALLSQSPVAQGILVLVGLFTLCVASIVMATRISIKVRLAWSTCAQMGMMLVECGLGLYELAMLHIVAHSAYKSYAFLNAGSQVSQQRLRSVLPQAVATGQHRDFLLRLLVLPISLCLVVASLIPALFFLQLSMPPWFAIVLVAIGVAPFFWSSATAPEGIRTFAALKVFALVQLYLVWHSIFSLAAAPELTKSSILLNVATFGIVALFAMQAWLSVYSRTTLARELHHWAYGGLFIDEFWTARTVRLWPLRLSPEQYEQERISEVLRKLLGGKAWS